jgi:hypothetical protein
MKKFWIAKTENGIVYGQTQWGEEISTSAKTFEFFTNETDWKQQISHYASQFDQNITDIGEMAKPGEDLFPYENRNTTIFITTSQITEMLLSPYKELIDYALKLPNKKTEEGYYIYIETVANEQMTEEQVLQVLESFNVAVFKK